MNKFISPIYIVFAAAALRLLPHEPNFTPVAAMAMFGGAYLNKKSAILLPLAIMLISDYLLLYINPFNPGNSNINRFIPFSNLIHSTTIFVYLSFIISALVGIMLRNNKKPLYVISASVFISIQFFIITNFGVWLTGYYPKTYDGLVATYIAGIPFFKGTFFGDIFYTSLFFGGYKLLLRLFKKPLTFISH